MQRDKEGFLYPMIAKEDCIDCGLCEKVCPVIHLSEAREPLEVYAAMNRDEAIRITSSSGGIFTLLAEQVIREGGVIFGARFNEKWEVVHVYTETIEGLEEFRGSKYVQSRIGKTYEQAESFLKQRRKVLFSGTPCQIAGLRLYLQREYDNLLTVDLICHGVPSPMIWQMYLAETIRKLKAQSIEKIDFRNKIFGWRQYSFKLIYKKNSRQEEYIKKSTDNLYIKGFLSDLYLRPSCYDCPVKCLKSGSDITLGDFWGIEHIRPERDDDKGISAVLVNTQRGIDLFSKIDAEKILFSYGEVSRGNQMLVTSVKTPTKRNEFWNCLLTQTCTEAMTRYTRLPKFLFMKIYIYNLLKHFRLK